MDITGWEYYNHAAIPTTAPHISPDTKPIADGTIWKMEGTPLLARWTTEFDCGYETNWWFVIREAPFIPEQISKKEMKSICQALKKCYVKKIDFADYSEEIYECYCSAFSKYENADNMLPKERFMEISKSEPDNVEYWGGFDVESNKLIGYITAWVYEVYAETRIAKFNPDFSKKRVSDALYYTVLNYYLNDCSKKYISSGSRNINHKTNTQEYKIRRFGYRKAYCKLHIEYNPKVRIIMKIAYFFKDVLKKFDNITLIHQINSLLKMEELLKNN